VAKPPCRGSMGGGSLARGVRGRGRQPVRSRSIRANTPGPRRPAGQPGGDQSGRTDVAGARFRGPAAALDARDPLGRRGSGASCSASRTPGATWHRSAPGPCRSTGATGSPDARSGPPTPSSRTGGCAWPAPTSMRPDPSRESRPWRSTCAPRGVDIRPLVQLTGDAEFNEVFLDEVFVRGRTLIRPEGHGWTVAGSTLAHERGDELPLQRAGGPRDLLGPPLRRGRRVGGTGGSRGGRRVGVRPGSNWGCCGFTTCGP